MAGNLSDSELSKKLRALGVAVGPITSTTRDVYYRKYKALLAQKPPPATSPPSKHNKPLIPPEQPSTPPATPPATPPPPPPVVSAPPPAQVLDRGAKCVVEGLLASFNNWSHVASDTVFMFPGGEVILASRAVLATQCSNMIPILYNSQVPYPVKVSTLSGQSSEFMVRGGELVRDLKQKICLAHAIPVPKQRLVFKQQEMLDSCSFESLQILSGATLHLVLVNSDLPSTTPCYSCVGVTPVLSIHHFVIGLSPEQLTCLAGRPPLPPQTASPLQAPPCVALPPHITHLVHAHDMPYAGFKKFLCYLYSRKLQQGDESDHGNQPGCFIMCYILGTYFQLSELADICLAAIENLLTAGNVGTVLKLAQSLENLPLQHLCMQFINASNRT